jgi:hypothetical protein
LLLISSRAHQTCIVMAGLDPAIKRLREMELDTMSGEID